MGSSHAGHNQFSSTTIGSVFAPQGVGTDETSIRPAPSGYRPQD